jgi:hypothetical protein
VTRRLPLLDHRRFVVTAAEQPGSLGQPPVELADPPAEGVDALHSPQVEHRRQQMADLPDMSMRVVETGDEGASAQIDPPGPSRRRGRHAVAADRRNAPVADHDGCRFSRERGRRACLCDDARVRKDRIAQHSSSHSDSHSVNHEIMKITKGHDGFVSS